MRRFPVLVFLAFAGMAGCAAVLGIDELPPGDAPDGSVTDGAPNDSSNTTRDGNVAADATNGTDAAPRDGGSDADAVADAAPIEGLDAACVKGGCFVCEPALSIEFLNACTTGVCAPFDNARILGWDGGDLPPLP